MSVKKQKSGGFFGGEVGTSLGYGSYDGFSTNLNFNIIGGYQWYFIDSNPRFHFRLQLKGYFGYNHTMANYVAINGFQYGIEMQLIWDFLAKHTLGIHISPPFPLSRIEVMHTFHKNIRNSFGNNWYNETINTTNRWRQIQLSFPMSRFHYYYDIKHQIFATLKPHFLIYAESYPYYNLDEKHTNSIFALGYTYKF